MTLTKVKRIKGQHFVISVKIAKYNCTNLNYFSRKKKRDSKYNNNVSKRDHVISKSACTEYMQLKIVLLRSPIIHFLLVKGSC